MKEKNIIKNKGENNQFCESCNSCNFCNSCNYCYFCYSCESCKSCNSCNFCKSCNYCYSCRNLVNGFMCINLELNEKDENKYWIFNKEVTKKEWDNRFDLK